MRKVKIIRTVADVLIGILAAFVVMAMVVIGVSASQANAEQPAAESYLTPTPVEMLAAEEAADESAIDLTPVINAGISLLGEILLAVIAVVILPPLRNWMQAKMSKTMQDKSLDMIRQLVLAAEQLFVGSGRGQEKFDYVVRGLRERGFAVDMGLIEAAVHQMNSEIMQVFEGELSTVEEPPDAVEDALQDCSGM